MIQKQIEINQALTLINCKQLSYKGSQSVVSPNVVFRAITGNSKTCTDSEDSTVQSDFPPWCVHIQLRLSTLTYTKAEKCNFFFFFFLQGPYRIQGQPLGCSVTEHLLQLADINKSPTLHGEGEQATIQSPKIT